MNGIQSTTNYAQFQYIQGNRNIMPGHVAKLTSSILKKNMLPQNPILVNEKMEVIDGQHRLEVAKNNELEIFYLVLPGAHFTEIIALNANNRVWTSRDYVNSYASQGKADYIWLADFMDNYALSITQAQFLIFGDDGTHPRAQITTGRLELSDAQKERGVGRADFLWEIRPFMKRSGFIPRAFLIETIHAYDEGLADKIIAGVKKRGKPFVPESSRKEAYEQLRLLMA